MVRPVSETAGAWERFRATRIYESLDGLRALSIVAVLLYHCDVPLPGLLGARGYLGVSLFFAISGFLITTLLLREKQDLGAISLRHFYARRALRLFPLYYAVLAAFCLATLAFDRHSEAGRVFWHHLPFFMFYMNNWVIALGTTRVIFAASWSLATEEQFYLFWPSILAAVRRTSSATIVVCLVLVWTCTIQILIAHGVVDWGAVPNRIAASVPSAICGGCLLALALHDPRAFSRLYRLLGWRGAPVVALVLLLVLPVLPGEANPLPLVMVALLGSVVVRPDHALKGLFQNPAARHVGRVSYGIYLLFTLVLNVGTRLFHLQSPWLRFAWTAPVTIGLATLTYRYYETPFLRLKARFSATTPRPRVEPAGEVVLPQMGVE
jgi:peptidoglycan/LPS O-acetylase OafA/YrhL